MGRRDDAIAIWEALTDSEDEAVRATAVEMVDFIPDQQILAPLEEHVLAPSELTAEMQALLDSAIVLLDNGEIEASLFMLNCCVEEGRRSP